MAQGRPKTQTPLIVVDLTGDLKTPLHVQVIITMTHVTTSKGGIVMGGHVKVQREELDPAPRASGHPAFVRVSDPRVFGPVLIRVVNFPDAKGNALPVVHDIVDVMYNEAHRRLGERSDARCLRCCVQL